MIFDYAMLSAFLLCAVLFVILNYLRSSLKKIVIKLNVRELNAFNLNMLVFYFFLAFILLAKIIIILSLPLQLKQFSMQIPVYSRIMFFLITQGMVIAVYIFAIVIIVVHWNLKPNFRYIFLAKVLKFILYFALAEFVVSALSYANLNFHLLFFQEPVLHTWFSGTDVNLLRFLSVAMLLLLALAFISLWLLNRKQRPGIHALFIAAALLTLVVELIVAAYHFQFVHIRDLPALPISTLFSFPEVIFSWLWFFLILFIPGALIYGYILMKLDSSFLNIYFARNYSLQLNKIVFLCLLGVGANALFPGFLIYLFS